MLEDSEKGMGVIRTTSYAYHAAARGYTVDRGIYDRWEGTPPGYRHKINGYVTELKEFQGKNVLQIIDGIVQMQGRARILDVGCGSGKFLGEVKDKYGDRVDCFGITAYNYSYVYSHPGISIILGDAQHLPIYFYNQQEFDLATAVNSVGWIADPWAVVSGMYELLKRDGVGLINSFPLSVFRDDTTRGVLEKYGFTISESFVNPSYGCISIRKTKRTVRGLLRADGLIDDHASLLRIGYAIDQQALDLS